MKCPLLKGKYMITCTAVQEGYIPSLFELEEYCRQAKHRTCPLFRAADAGPNGARTLYQQAAYDNS